ncbi:hypothetical protein D3C83_01200 [compost metagenome]
MRPQPRSTMPSHTGLVMLNTLSRLVRSTASQSTLPILLNVMSRVMPALLTSTSIAPASDWIIATAFWHESKSATSTGTARISKPLAFMFFTQSAHWVLPGE